MRPGQKVYGRHGGEDLAVEERLEQRRDRPVLARLDLTVCKKLKHLLIYLL